MRSLAEPLGNKPTSSGLFRAGDLKKRVARKHKRTAAMYLTQVPELVGDVARFES